jgi:hypothetical protein
MRQKVLCIAVAACVLVALSTNGPAQDAADRTTAEHASAADMATFTYAEGYSSLAPDTPADLGYRMFTIYSKPCEGLPIPVRLVASPAMVTLKSGQRFQLQDIVVHAYDASGTFIARQPIGATLVFPRGVLEFVSDQDRNFAVTALGSGNASAVFTAHCAKNTLQAKIAFMVG